MSSDKLYSEIQMNELKEEDTKTSVCIIYTGGTIGMVPMYPDNPANKSLRAASLEDLMNAVPNLGKNEGIQLGLVSFNNPVDSSDISVKEWISIGLVIQEYYDKFDGFVVLHGTDTMAYTTSALSFILNNLAKPVVVTGSQLPIKAPRTDAVMNLTTAIYIAGYKAVGLPCIPEVVLCFMDRILRGNRATKVSASKWQGFDSPNYPPIGTIGEEIKIRKESILKPDAKTLPFRATTKLAKEIRIIQVHPGLTPEQLKRDLNTEGLEGVILMTYGAGNMPTSKNFISTIKDAVEGRGIYKKSIGILSVTQCLEGKVEMGLYDASSGLLDAGVASGLDITFEAALSKMYWALAKFNGHELRNQLQINQRGEQSQNLFDLTFLTGHNSRNKAISIIKTDSRNIPGNFDTRKLRHAVLRIHGLGFKKVKNNDSTLIRIFIHEDADEDTSTDEITFAKEIDVYSVSDNKNIKCDVTNNIFDHVSNLGYSIYVTIVGINCKIWCNSIHINLYTETE